MSRISRLFSRSVRSRRRRRRWQPVAVEGLEERCLLTIDLLSLAPGSASGAGLSEDPQLSRNGKFVAFQSRADDLVIGGATDTNGFQDIFVRNLEDDTTILLSVTRSGRSGNDDSWSPSISDDGRFVAFVSFATDLDRSVGYIAGPNVFVHDRDTDKDGIFDEPGATRVRLLSYSGTDFSDSGNGPSGGITLGGQWDRRPIISADGSTVVFGSSATNLLDTADGVVAFGNPNVYSVSSRGGKIRLVSINSTLTASGTAPGGGVASNFTISGNGRLIAFQSSFTDLITDDIESVTDIFVGGSLSGKVVRASESNGGKGGNGASSEPVVSRDGNHVVFQSFASNFVDGDLNAVADLFVHDLRKKTTTLVSMNRDPATTGSTGNAASSGVGGLDKGSYTISDNGRYIVFASLASNLLDPADGISDTNGTMDVFWLDRDFDGNGIFDEPGVGRTRTKLVSVSAGGTAASNAIPATGGSAAVSVSGDGRYVLFTSPGTDLVPGGTAGTGVYLRDVFAGATTFIALTGTPAALQLGVRESGLATNPLRIAFSSIASTLDPSVTDANSLIDVFSYDAPADIVFGGMRTNGTDRMQVGYRIENTSVASPFELGVYRSSDSTFQPGTDELLGTVTISGTGLDVGARAVTMTIGSGAGEIPLPGFGAAETGSDYELLFVLDHLNTVTELDVDPFNDDNVGRFSGIYHPAAGPVMIHGRGGDGPRADDRVLVTEPDASTVRVAHNGRVLDFAASDVTAVRFRGHEGDDFAQTAGTPDLLIGGAGNDELRGGGGDDIIAGGAGNDRLFGELGFDYIYDGSGDDFVDLGGSGPDGGTVISTPGSDDIFIGAGDTIDFSLDDLAITLDLDSEAVQRVDAAGNTVQLIGDWDDFFGSAFGDHLTVRKPVLPRILNGGDGDDSVVIDADGDTASYDGTSIISFGSGASITLTSFESIRVINSLARIVDDGDVTGFTHTGFFDSDPGFPQGYNNGVKFSGAGSGNTAAWTFSNIPPGRYRVSATWTNAPDRAKDSPFTIRNGGASGPVVAQFDLNQEAAPSDFSEGGLMWEDLQIVDVTGNQLTVQLSDAADQFVVADAIRIEPIHDQLIIDDRSTQFTPTGGTVVDGAGLMGGERTFNAGAGSVVGIWSTTGLTQPVDFRPGPYRVSATWTQSVGAATNAPFSATNGSDVISRQLNQFLAPNDFISDGVSWEQIGTLNLNSYADFSAQLQNNANGSVIADAVRLDPLPDVELARFGALGNEWESLLSGSTVDLGTVARDGSGDAHATARFRIDNRGPGVFDFDPLTVTGTGFTLQTPPPTHTIPPGGWTEFEVDFDGTLPGGFDGSVVVTASDPLVSLVNIQPHIDVVDDNIPPTVMFVSPATGSGVVEGTSFRFQVEAIDDVALRQVDLLVNGDLLSAIEAPHTFEYEFPGGSLPPLNFPVQVTAFDVAGNTAVETVDIRWLTDTPPDVRLLPPAPGVDPFALPTSLPVQINADDVDRISQIDIFINGDHLATIGPDVIEVPIPQLPINGPSTITAVVTDRFGVATPLWPPVILVPSAELSLWSPPGITDVLQIPGGAEVQFPPGDEDFLRPHFEWNPLAGAQSYELFDRNLNSGAFTHLTGLIQPHHQPANPLERGTHRLWVRAVDLNGDLTPWTDPFDLPLTPPIPGPTDTIVARLDTSSVDSTPVVQIEIVELSLRSVEPITITDANPIATAEIFIRDLIAPRQPDILIRDIDTAVFELRQGLLNDDYRLWTRLTDPTGQTGPWSDPVDFSINVPLPGAPNVTSPSGTVQVSPPTIAWNPSLFADTYDVLIRRTDKAQPDILQNVDNFDSFTPSAVLANGAYKAWVLPRTSTGNAGLWSAAAVFAIDVPTPALVTGVQRVGGANPVTIGWQPALHASRYEMWVRNMDTGQNPVYQNNNLTSVQHTIPTALPAGNYRVWIRAINSQGVKGPWSAPFDFVV
jgi:RTX calcium-binding nonapeptide repeat (4 copies)/Bacterial Ig domain